MNLQILSAMLEDHLTNEDIQEAQALLEWTYEEMVYIHCQLSKAQAEIDALKAQNAELLALLERCRSWLADGENSDDSGFYPEYASHEYIRAIQGTDEAIAKARGDLCAYLKFDLDQDDCNADDECWDD